MARKLALIIGNNEYQDVSLAKLVTPGEDVNDLAEVLRAPDVGGFDQVITLVNESDAAIRLSIEDFFADKAPDDLVLMYFSGHGVRDEQGHLFLAVNNTRATRLRATAIPAEFITSGMDRSRSKRQVLILDCCHSGAFAQGAKAMTGESVGIGPAFEGSGYGRVVLTATDATQYAWEGDKVIGQADNSVFTHYLIEGLKTGAADTDNDGRITVGEIYDYVYGQVVAQTPKQTPGKWSYKQQGDIVIAQNPHPATKSVALSIELQQSIDDSRPWVRESAVRELDRLLASNQPGLALAAQAGLKHLAEDDSRKVAAAAVESLNAYEARLRIEAERLAQEKAERDRLEQERLEAARLTAQQAEETRLAQEKVEQERAATERAKQEHIAKEKVEQQRIAEETAKQEQIAQQRAEQERFAKDRAEQTRIAQNAQRAEQERLAKQRAEEERRAREKAQQQQRAEPSAGRLAAVPVQPARWRKIPRWIWVVGSVLILGAIVALLAIPAAQQQADLNVLERVQSQWHTVLFDRNDMTNQWEIGAYNDPSVTVDRQIVDGKYRLDMTAKGDFAAVGSGLGYPGADFYLEAEVQQLSGQPACTYGLTYRHGDNGFDFMLGDSDQKFTAFASGENGTGPLIDWTESTAIRAGGINKLAIIAEGSRYHFFINDQRVGDFSDNQVTAGNVTLQVQLCNAGDTGVFEFGNVELRAP